MERECEAKIRVENLKKLKKRLKDMGAIDKGACLERNWVLDDDKGSLRKRGTLMRIRNNGGTGGVLTVKRPVKGDAFKNREEIETHVESTDVLLAQFGAMGYRVNWIYEKYRQTWHWRDCVMMLDECPEMGFFIEIEGTPKKILKAAEKLGLNPEKHIDASYRKLWKKHLSVLGQESRHMVFPGSDGSNPVPAASS